MEDDGAEIGIFVVAVRMPAGGLQVNFEVAADGRLIVELDDGTPEVGSALDAEETGVKYPDGSSV